MISRLGRFQIDAEIGRGGFGQVFRAHDPLMNRIVAVKVLTATEDAGSFNRFKNEATAAGNLRHENIVTIFEFGQEGQVPFLVMEYLNGEDLQHIIGNQSPLSLYQKVRIMDQVADGLHCAHLNGVLHRDVKPANIMVLKDGAVKIMDFGIARLVRDSSTRLTQHGYLIGTVVYMAPELLTGEETEVDASCDIWSYGVVLYELLSGKNPFRTGSVQSEMYRIVNHDPAPLPPETCPPDLQAVITRLLSRPRGLRYQTLEETRFDLQPILNNLKKAEADRLVSVAEQLMFQRQWSAALDAAREARKMDPQNGTARVIFDRVQDELRKQSVHPRVEDLLRRSSEAADRKNVAEAIGHLEAALTFDSSNERVLFRLNELRSLKAKREEAVNLVSEASARFRSGRLTEAFEHASEAVSLDPDNQEGQRLFESIQKAIQDVQAERALEAEILRIRGLMAVDDLDGAMQTLKAAEPNYSGNSTIKNLMVQISGRIADRERRLEFSRRLDHAKVAVRSARFDEALKELEQLQGAYPQEGEVGDLLAYVRQELKAKGRNEELKRISDSAAELNRKQNFCEAIQVLEDGLKRYPEDIALARLIRSTYSELQNFEREKALRAGLQRCEALRQGAKWQEALNLVALLVSDNPNNRELAELDVKIRQEKNQAERTGAIRTAVEEAERSLQDHQPDAAVKVLETAIRAIGPEAQLKELLKKAEQVRQTDRDRQYIESELKHAKVFEERGDIPTSLKIIDGALRRSPKSPELLAARERLSLAEENAAARANAEQKRAFISENLKQAALCAQKDDSAGALAIIQEALKKYAADPELSAEKKRLQDAISHAERERALAEKTAAIKRDVERGNWQDALKKIAEARAGFPENPDLISLERQARELREREAALKEEKAREGVIAKAGSQAPAGIAMPRPEEVVPRDDVQPKPKWLIYGIAGVVLAGLAGLAIWMRSSAVTVSPEKLSFAYQPGASPAAQTIRITGSSDVGVPRKSADWVTVTRGQQGSGTAEFEVQVSPEKLPPGTYTDMLTFPNDKKVSVNLVVSQTGLDIQPASLTFPYSAGGIPGQRIVVTSPAAIPDPKPSERWLTFTRHKAGAGKAEFIVQVSANGLPPGLHSALLVFSAARKVPVTLMIPGGPTSGVYPTFLALSEDSPEQTITFTGPGEIPDPTSSEPWLTVTRGTESPGKAEFLVKASPGELEPGKYRAYLTFPTDKRVQVELTIPEDLSSLQVKPESLAFPGGGAMQTITVTASGDIPNPTVTVRWVKVSRRDLGAGIAAFDIQASPAGLVAGPHVAYVNFSPLKKVRIVLTVGSPPSVR